VDEEKVENDAVESVGQEVVDDAHLHVEVDIGRKDVQQVQDDDGDNVPLSSKIKALRSDKAADDDDIILSIMFQTTPLIPIESDLEMIEAHHDEEIEVEVEGEKPVEMGSKFEDNNLVYFGADG
ncbi:hypothetical protein Dimus_022256, partial [Dionaea muscipula]